MKAHTDTDLGGKHKMIVKFKAMKMWQSTSFFSDTWALYYQR
jgi:hypothetical protein